MKSHHQTSFFTELFVTAAGRIAIKQKVHPENQTVFLTHGQALLLIKNLPDYIKEAQEQEQAYRKVQNKLELDDE